MYPLEYAITYKKHIKRKTSKYTFTLIHALRQTHTNTPNLLLSLTSQGLLFNRSIKKKTALVALKQTDMSSSM